MENQKKPILVWIITIYLGLTVLGGLLGNLLYLIPLPDVELPSRSTTDWILVWIGILLPFLYALYLFRMDAKALYVSVAWLVLGIIGVARAISNETVSIGINAASIGLIFVIALIGYTYYLRKTNRLSSR